MLVIGIILILTASALAFELWNHGNSSSNAPSPSAALTLALSLNASTIKAGHDIGFTASLFNTLQKVNEVPAANEWAVPNLIMSPCGPIESPIAYVVVPGFYTSANASEAPRVDYGQMCTTESPVASYYFQPLSDQASLNASCSPCPYYVEMGTTGSILSYWNAGVPSPFTPGVYTVVAADEWGHVTVAHFNVG